MTGQPSRRRLALVRVGCALWPAVALLQACSALPSRDGDDGWTQGRLLLRVDASPERSAQSVTAAFELRGDSHSGELRLLSPLGTRLATALWSPQRAHLATPEGEQSYASLDDLSRQALGESVPLAALPDWLAGRPWTGAAHQLQPLGFEQLGWLVTTTGRAAGLVEARRAAPPAVLLRVRLEQPA